MTVSPTGEPGGSPALDLALKAHAGQADKGGAPYILHCLAVAHGAFALALEEARCEEMAFRCYIAGLLHDVVEDSDHTLADIRMVASEEIARAVGLLTKPAGADRAEYMAAVAGHPIARIVKMADLTHNMDLGRIRDPQPRDLERAARYRAEYDALRKRTGEPASG